MTTTDDDNDFLESLNASAETLSLLVEDMRTEIDLDSYLQPVQGDFTLEGYNNDNND